MEFQSKNYNQGLKIGPYPDKTCILVNIDGSLFIESTDNGDIFWTPLESKGEWLVKTNKTYRGKPTDDYINIKYRKMIDATIGYLNDKTLKIHTMYNNINDIYISISLSDGSDIKYGNGKYYIPSDDTE